MGLMTTEDDEDGPEIFYVIDVLFEFHFAPRSGAPTLTLVPGRSAGLAFVAQDCKVGVAAEAAAPAFWRLALVVVGAVFSCGSGGLAREALPRNLKVFTSPAQSPSRQSSFAMPAIQVECSDSTTLCF